MIRWKTAAVRRDDATAASGGQRDARDRAGWRRLGAFWVGVLLLLTIGTGVVQYLGPPTPVLPAGLAPNAPRLAAGEPAHAQPAGTPKPGLAGSLAAGRDTPGPVAGPDPALLQPLTEGSKQNLPRIASDRRVSMRVYAAGFDHASRRPRVGLLLAGIGLNEAESEAAIRGLPGAVSLAVSPYAAANGENLAKLLETARAAGHEYLAAIPLEPAGFPLNDPGPATLLTSLPANQNVRNLYWALSRFDGYVGATGVIGTMRGERLAAMTDQMDAVLSELAARGLLYVDPREGRGPVAKTWGRHVDLVIDDPADQGAADRTMIDAKLAALEQQAHDAGSSLGLVMRPTPVAVARIGAWAYGLADRGLALAPVSALAVPPAAAEPVKVSEREH